MRKNAWKFLLWVVLILAPGIAHAQSSITGVVRDTSGAVLPGVTVEASSDVLIEKVRTAVSDSNGLYRIVDLRPGTYAVSFTLPGFKTYLRDGLVLAAEFNATVNADMSVGGLEETITVTGESPIVDVQSAKRQRTLDSDLVQALPTAKGYAAVMVLIPSMVQSGGGVPNVQLSPGMVVFGGRGGRGNEGRAQVDGLEHRRLAQRRRRLRVPAGRRERGGDRDHDRGRPRRNRGGRPDDQHRAPHRRQHVPVARLLHRAAAAACRRSNYTDELKAAGLRTPAKTNYIYDTSYSIGGPIKRDKIWFYFLGYYRGSENNIPGMFYNRNEWDPNKLELRARRDPPRAFPAAAARSSRHSGSRSS